VNPCRDERTGADRALAPAEPARPQALGAPAILALQRTAGNAAVAAMLARRGAPSVGERQKRLEERQAATEHDMEILGKRQAVSEQDARWRARIAARLASWTQATARMTTAMDSATSGFRGAQSAQALADAVELQLVGAAFALGFAAGFQWMFTAAVGRGACWAPRPRTGWS
jgi:hypothetical protein